MSAAERPGLRARVLRVLGSALVAPSGLALAVLPFSSPAATYLLAGFFTFALVVAIAREVARRFEPSRLGAAFAAGVVGPGAAWVVGLRAMDLMRELASGKLGAGSLDFASFADRVRASVSGGGGERLLFAAFVTLAGFSAIGYVVWGTAEAPSDGERVPSTRRAFLGASSLVAAFWIPVSIALRQGPTDGGELCAGIALYVFMSPVGLLCALIVGAGLAFGANVGESLDEWIETDRAD